MKEIFIFLFCFVFLPECKAQVFDISEYKGIDNTPVGTYYKDTHNFLDPFVGTYVYTNGNNSLKIVLQKKVMAAAAKGRYNEDLIIGGYQYIKNGIEKINTLDQLNTNLDNAWKYTINGNSILTGQVLGCDDCTPTEKRLRLGLIDNTINNFAELIVRKVVVNGQPALKIRLSWNGRSRPEGTTLPQPALPDGDYTLIKQP